jgi:hypothetical protein
MIYQAHQVRLWPRLLKAAEIDSVLREALQDLMEKGASLVINPETGGLKLSEGVMTLEAYNTIKAAKLQPRAPKMGTVLSNARTISPANLPGRTTTPSDSPLTVIDTSMVRSVSLPVSWSALPVSCARIPDSTGIAPPRVDTARPALPSASTKTSRSHRNFTAARFLVFEF